MEVENLPTTELLISLLNTHCQNINAISTLYDLYERLIFAYFVATTHAMLDCVCWFRKNQL